MSEQVKALGLQDSNRFISNTFRRALFPAILSVGGVMASTLANSLIAGNLLENGGEALAILSIANPVYFVFATIGSLAGAGASSLAAWCIGREDYNGRDAAVTLAALLSLGVSLLLAVLGVIFLDPLVALLGAKGNLIEPTRQYLSIYLFSGIGISGIYPPYFLLKLEGRNRLSMALFLGLAVSCVGLELLCVLVLGMGLQGIALGCAVANVGTAVIGWIFLIGKKSSFRICPLSGIWGRAPRMLLAGSPAALNNLCSVLRGVALNQMIATLAGQMGLSAFSIVSMASNLSLIFINGLTQTTGPFVGVFTSERDNASLRQLERQALRMGLLLIAPAAVILMLLAVPFCRLFGITETQTLAMTVPAVRFFAVSFVPAMLSSILMNYYLASRHTGLANLLTVCRSYLMVVVSLRILTIPMGITGVWLSFTTAELLSWLVIGVALVVWRWIRPQQKGLLLLDKRYEEEGKFISFSVHSTQKEILDASFRITAFSEENELDPQQTMLLSLSIEELLISIKDHCFPDQETEEINVRILIAPGEYGREKPIIMRIRCSGVPFNPIEYYQHHKAKTAAGLQLDDVDALIDGLDDVDDLLSGLDDSLGIAMIVEAAPIVDYKTTFGVNNLTIIV